jgi:outer membrane receptor protein involved in Fe transport
MSTTNWADVRTGGSRIGKIDVTGGYVKVDHDFGKAAHLDHVLRRDQGQVRGGQRCVRAQLGPNHDGLNQRPVINFDTTHKFSQELRLASAGASSRFRWVTGLYYFNENSTQGQNIRFGDNGVLLFRFLSGNDHAFVNTMGFSIAELKDRSYAAYGQADIGLTDKLTFTGGLRFTQDEKKNPSYYSSIDITGRPQSTYYGQQPRALARRGLGATPSSPRCAENDTSRSGVRTSRPGLRSKAGGSCAWDRRPWPCGLLPQVQVRTFPA